MRRRGCRFQLSPRSSNATVTLYSNRGSEWAFCIEIEGRSAWGDDSQKQSLKELFVAWIALWAPTHFC